MTHCPRRIAYVLLFTLLSIPVVYAQAGGGGHLQAHANGALPAGARISVEATSFGNRVDKVQETLIAGLIAQGFNPSDDAPLILRFHINDTAEKGPGGRDVVVSGRGGSKAQTEVEVDVLLRSRQQADKPPRLGLQLFLFRKGQPPIWSATASAPRGQQDPAATLVKMAETAVNYIGQTKERALMP